MPSTVALSVQARIDPKQVVEVATQVLTSQNFAIAPARGALGHGDGPPSEARAFEGPGMHGNQQNALLGARRVEVLAWPHRVALTADLSTTDRLFRVLGVGLGLMGVGMVIGFGIGFGLKQGLMSALPLAPWPVLLPWMHRRQKSKTRHALEALLHNAISQSRTRENP